MTWFNKLKWQSCNLIVSTLWTTPVSLVSGKVWEPYFVISSVHNFFRMILYKYISLHKSQNYLPHGPANGWAMHTFLILTSTPNHTSVFQITSLFSMVPSLRCQFVPYIYACRIWSLCRSWLLCHQMLSKSCSSLLNIIQLLILQYLPILSTWARLGRGVILHLWRCYFHGTWRYIINKVIPHVLSMLLIMIEHHISMGHPIIPLVCSSHRMPKLVTRAKVRWIVVTKYAFFLGQVRPWAMLV